MDTIPSKLTEKAWIAFLRSQQILITRVETTLKAAGFPPLSWYDVLVELDRDPNTSLRQYEIGNRILLNKHNLSRLIDRLEHDGLVKRQTCDADNRGNTVSITKKGTQLKNAMWPVYAKEIQGLLGETLTTAQIRSLLEVTGVLLQKHSLPSS